MLFLMLLCLLKNSHKNIPGINLSYFHKLWLSSRNQKIPVESNSGHSQLFVHGYLSTECQNVEYGHYFIFQKFYLWKMFS